MESISYLRGNYNKGLLLGEGWVWLPGAATLRRPPFLVGALRYSFSFVTKREAEKSRYFRGAGHGLRALGFVLRTNASQARP